MNIVQERAAGRMGLEKYSGCVQKASWEALFDSCTRTQLFQNFLAVMFAPAYKGPSLGGKVFRYILPIIVMSLVSCGFKNSPVVELKKDSGIIGGTLVSEKSPLAAVTVSVYDLQENVICTGTLIAENFVVTAAHCIPPKTSKLKVIFATDVDDMLATREQDLMQEYVRKVVEVKVHPSYNQPGANRQVDVGDIALVKFAGALPAGYKITKRLEDASVLKPGVSVTLAGYGVSLVNIESVQAKDIKNLDEAIEYGDVICDQGLVNCMKVEMTGDGVLRTTTAPIASLQMTEVRLDESKGHGTCSGDSGGPAFIEQNGEYLFFGITSRGSQFCDGIGVYTNAVYYKNWIADTMKVMNK